MESPTNIDKIKRHKTNEAAKLVGVSYNTFCVTARAMQLNEGRGKLSLYSDHDIVKIRKRIDSDKINRKVAKKEKIKTEKHEEQSFETVQVLMSIMATIAKDVAVTKSLIVNISEQLGVDVSAENKKNGYIVLEEPLQIGAKQ